MILDLRVDVDRNKIQREQSERFGFRTSNVWQEKDIQLLLGSWVIEEVLDKVKRGWGDRRQMKLENRREL